jgi:hypothetical protein
MSRQTTRSEPKGRYFKERFWRGILPGAGSGGEKKNKCESPDRFSRPFTHVLPMPVERPYAIRKVNAISKNRS